MDERDKKTIGNMIEYIDDAANQIEHVTLDACEKDRKTQHAVSFCLQQIGDELKNVSPETQVSNPQIPWRAVSGLRNSLVHSYKDVALESVWKFLQRDLPPLRESLVIILEKG
jgi:uncharacterized protein with HEPN domain